MCYVNSAFFSGKHTFSNTNVFLLWKTKIDQIKCRNNSRLMVGQAHPINLYIYIHHEIISSPRTTLQTAHTHCTGAALPHIVSTAHLLYITPNSRFAQLYSSSLSVPSGDRNLVCSINRYIGRSWCPYSTTAAPHPILGRPFRSIAL